MADQTAQDILRHHETCYAYNESFDFYYKIPMPRHKCEELVADRNQCKGGHWEVRRMIEWKDDFELKFEKKRGGDGSVFLEKK